MARRLIPRFPRYYGRSRRVLLSAFLGGDTTEDPSETLSTLVASPWAFTDADTDLTVTTKDANDDAMAGVVWAADAETITIDPFDCYVTTDVSDINSDGVDVCTISIQVKHDVGEAETVGLRDIPASQFVVTVSGTGNTITQPSVATNSAGATTASFVTTEASVTKTITVTCGGLTIGTTTVTTDAGPPPEPAPGDPFFEDSFAGLQVNNANGFVWGTGKNTSIVSFGGFDCMRFRYEDAGSSSGPNAERRFDLGRDVTHLWIEYDVYIPANFDHPNISVNNNKWMVLWRDVYSDVTNGTWQIGYEFRTNSSEAPGSEIRAMARRWDYNFWSSAGPNYTPTGQFDTFINASGPVVVDDWNQIRMEYATATDDSSSDGIQRMWVNGVLFLEITTGRFWNYPASVDTPADCFLRNGYFFGTANSGYSEQTDFHIKAVKFYNSDPGWV